MEIVTFQKDFIREEPCEDGHFRRIIRAGRPYLVYHTEAVLAQMNLQDLGAEVEELAARRRGTKGRSCLLVWPGSLGDTAVLCDVLAQSPLCRPDVFLGIATDYQSKLLFQTVPGINAFFPYPVEWEQAQPFERMADFDGIMESAAAREVDIHDLFAGALGLTYSWVGWRFPIRPYRAWARQAWPPSRKKRVALHLRASVISRQYHLGRAALVAYGLAQAGCEVFLLGGWDDFAGFAAEKGAEPTLPAEALHPDLHSLTGRLTNPLHLLGFLSTCDLFIGPDSGPLHLAAYEGVPGLALFGQSDERLRLKYYPGLTALRDPDVACGPCYHVGAQMPCEHELCPALNNINPRYVVERARELLHGR